MGYVKNEETSLVLIGKKVKLTQEKVSIAGHFTKGSIVTITACDLMRGYTFTDAEGNSVAEAGFGGFEVL